MIFSGWSEFNPPMLYFNGWSQENRPVLMNDKIEVEFTLYCADESVTYVCMGVNDPPRWKCGGCLHGVVARIHGNTIDVLDKCKVCGRETIPIGFQRMD